MDLYDGRDPRNVPTYAVAEAAAWLKLAPSTLRSWLIGDLRGRPPLIATDSALSETKLLSFTNLVEAHVLEGIRHGHRIPMPVVRESLAYLSRVMPVPHPLARLDLKTDGVSLFVEHLGHLVNVSRRGQLAMQRVLEAHLRRIDRDEHGLAARLYPFTRPGHLERDQPRVVVIDPRVSFGRPVLAGTGVPTSALASRWQAGDSVTEIAEDFRCDPAQVEEALRTEYRHAA